jgi:hypothetical protein
MNSYPVMVFLGSKLVASTAVHMVLTSALQLWGVLSQKDHADLHQVLQQLRASSVDDAPLQLLFAHSTRAGGSGMSGSNTKLVQD